MRQSQVFPCSLMVCVKINLELLPSTTCSSQVEILYRQDACASLAHSCAAYSPNCPTLDDCQSLAYDGMPVRFVAWDVHLCFIHIPVIATMEADEMSRLDRL